MRTALRGFRPRRKPCRLRHRPRAAPAICYNPRVSLLAARDLGKSYGPQTLFSKASFAIREGERVGLLGHNGAGKSTLLRVLAGLEPPDEGNIERKRGLV